MSRRNLIANPATGRWDRVVFIQRWPGRSDYHVYLDVAWDGPFLGDVRKLADGRWEALRPDAASAAFEDSHSAFAATRREAVEWLLMRSRIVAENERWRYPNR